MLLANSYLHMHLTFVSFPICNSLEEEFCKQEKLKKKKTGLKMLLLLYPLFSAEKQFCLKLKISCKTT